MTLFLDRTEREEKKSCFDTAVAQEVADESRKDISGILGRRQVGLGLEYIQRFSQGNFLFLLSSVN